MPEISTFVIFDIETTGLPRYEKNQTKITEITFLAVHRRDIETTKYGDMPLVNKLSYLFNPQRAISREVTELTGLSTADLQCQPVFKSRIPIINSFLEELPKPVCLVAHNGNSFDFKLLWNEYIDAGAKLPDDLLCVDSLWGFKTILKETNLSHETLLRLNTPNGDNNDDILTDDDDDDNGYDAEWPELNTTPEDWEQIDKLVESIEDMLPLKDGAGPKGGENQEKDKKHTKRALAIQKALEKKIKPHISYKLQDLYKRLLNKEVVNAHRAEADCLMLLMCVAALKDNFLPYADNKSKSIYIVKPFERYSL